jgi:hypothetical protein
MILAQSTNLLKKKKRLLDLRRAILEQEIKSFSIPLGMYFTKLASFGYCQQNDLDSQNCCPDLLNREGWTVLAAETIEHENYNYAILKHDAFKKIVVTTPGTRNKWQLLREMRSSSGVSMDENNPTVKVMQYFNDIWKQLKLKVLPILGKAFKEHPDYQFIFTGHSLGAAMATIAAYDAVKSGAIRKTATSPVLLTYGQPRTGNDVFANEVMKHVAHVYRVVRNGDPVASLGICSYRLYPFMHCKSILEESKFNPEFTLSEKHIQKAMSRFYLWHVGGLMLFSDDMNNYENCGIEHGENHPKGDVCDNKESANIGRHIHYFNVHIGKHCRTRPNSQQSA